jgi:hypothetical protein
MCETQNFGTQVKYFSQIFETLLKFLKRLLKNKNKTLSLVS